jgi:hypothetical protein
MTPLIYTCQVCRHPVGIDLWEILISSAGPSREKKCPNYQTNKDLSRIFLTYLFFSFRIGLENKFQL